MKLQYATAVERQPKTETTGRGQRRTTPENQRGRATYTEATGGRQQQTVPEGESTAATRRQRKQREDVSNGQFQRRINGSQASVARQLFNKA